MDKKEQLNNIFHRLRIGDAVQRNNACDEALELISQATDTAEQDGLRCEIIYHLIDLGRFYDAEFVIEATQKSSNIDIRMASYFHRIAFCKRFFPDPSQVEAAILEAMRVADELGLVPAKIDAYKEYDVFLIGQERERDAITHFTEVVCYAENNNNPTLLAISKYYMGICLYHLGRLTIANNYLREATETAFHERNNILAQTSEAMRAIVLTKQGKTKEASVIMEQWEQNFSLLL